MRRGAGGPPAPRLRASGEGPPAAGGAAIGLRRATLALAPHDPGWAALYAAEAARIGEALRGLPFEVDHIGSTAVPGLPAKAIIDLALRVAGPHEGRVAEALVAIGYLDRGVRGGRLFIRLRDGDVRTHNLHLYEPHDPDCRDQIAFRDALRADPDLRGRYAALKRSLVERLGDAGRADYAGAKTDFVRAALARAR